MNRRPIPNVASIVASIAFALLCGVSTVLPLGTVAVAGIACSAAAERAFKAKSETGLFRMEAVVAVKMGSVRVSMDVILPDRMRTIFTAPDSKERIEVIQIAKRAWRREWPGLWTEVDPEQAGVFATTMRQLAVETDADARSWECLGREMYEGREVVVYRERIPGPAEGGVGTDGDVAERDTSDVVYVDLATGLPVRLSLSASDRSKKPLVEATFTYPKSISIEAPIAKDPE